MTKSESFITSIFVALIIGGFTYAVLSAMSLPDVWFSHSTGECVKVLNYIEGEEYTCENLPSRFYHVWVE